MVRLGKMGNLKLSESGGGVLGVCAGDFSGRRNVLDVISRGYLPSENKCF